MVSSRNFILRLNIGLSSPSKKECIHLTNLLYNSAFTSRSSMSITSPKIPVYYSDNKLSMLQTSQLLSTTDWSYDLCKELLEDDYKRNQK